MGDQGRKSVFAASPSAAVVFVEADECAVCGAAFSFFTRRHHCRNCGGSCCAAHSANSLLLPSAPSSAGQPASKTKKQRVCDPCHADPGRLLVAKMRRLGLGLQADASDADCVVVEAGAWRPAAATGGWSALGSEPSAEEQPSVLVPGPREEAHIRHLTSGAIVALQEPEPEQAAGADAGRQLQRTVSPHPAPEPAPEDSNKPPAAVGGYQTCIDRPFVQKEVRWAWDYDRPMITVFEEEARRQGHFDYGKARPKYVGTDWCASPPPHLPRCLHQSEAAMAQLLGRREPLLHIDSVVYRRDVEEAEAMLNRILKKSSGRDKPAPAALPLNGPGAWDFFLSHGQAAAGDQVKMLCFLLRQRGQTVWYDNEMADRSTPAMEEGVRHAAVFLLFLSGDPDLSAPPAAEVAAAASPGTAAQAREIYLHLAIQPPPLAIGQAKARAKLHARVAEIEARMADGRPDWLRKRQYPVCLSDGSSPVCELEAHLREGRLYGLVWCGKGYGWEHRARADAAAFMPSIDRILHIVRRSTEASRPELAVVCLECGARRAAAEFVAAGIRTVVWLEVDMLCESAVQILCDVIAPVLQSLQSGAGLENTSKQLSTVLSNFTAGAGGCVGADQVSNWTPPAGSEERWLRNLLPESPRHHNLALSSPGMSGSEPQLLACDLDVVSEIQGRLGGSTKERLIIRSPAGVPNTLARRRAVAYELCISQPGVAYRASTVEDVRSARAAHPALIWLDLFQPNVTSSTIFDAQEILEHGLKESDLIVTYDDSYSDEDVERFEEFMELEEEIIADVGAADIQADELHEEFKVWANFESDPDASHSLLDVFEPEQLAEAMQHLVRRPVQALYHADDSNAIFVRICISDVGFLHELRDKLLTGSFGCELAAALQHQDASRKDTCEALGRLVVSVDKTEFAKKYETSILRLNKLTPHQREALDSCSTNDGDLHITEAAGAGKTFVALHYMLEVLQGNKDARVLFVARNLPLAVFIVKWLVFREDESQWRVKSSPARRKLLGRLHLLFVPMEDGPRAVTLARNTIKTKLIAALPNYDLVVVDEAHHICADESLWAVVDGYTGTRRLLLSDISQGSHRETRFPEMPEVTLTEVVRSSKRIVAGAMDFQLLGVEKLKTECHHESDGPPLHSFLFEVADDQHRHQQYANQTARALVKVATEFPGLSFHDRLAVIVPDALFRERLKPLLAHQLSASLPERRFQLVDAATASATCGVGTQSAVSDLEWLVVDGVEEMDGLERLIVVCVGLDSSAADEELGALEARSMLYRAITRAHMMVLAVNENVLDGWLSFLTGIKFGEDQKFDARKALNTAKREAIDRKIVAAAARRQQLVVEAESLLAWHALNTAVPEGATLAKSISSGGNKCDRCLRNFVDGATTFSSDVQSTEASYDLCEGCHGDIVVGTPDHLHRQRRFLEAKVVLALSRGAAPQRQPTAAVATALRMWHLDELLARIPAAVTTAATAAGLAESETGGRCAESLAAVATAMVRGQSAELQEMTLEEATAAAIDRWQQASDTLSVLADQHGKQLSGSESTQLLVAIMDGTEVRDALTRFVVSEAATQRQLPLQYQDEYALLQMVDGPLSLGEPMQNTVEAALDEWQRIEQAVMAELRHRGIDTRWVSLCSRSDVRSVQIADVVAMCRDLPSGQTTEQVVSEAVDQWKQAVAAEDEERRKRNLEDQSVWDPSANDTARPATVGPPGGLEPEGTELVPFLTHMKLEQFAAVLQVGPRPKGATFLVP
jgi:hypothetical protein